MAREPQSAFADNVRGSDGLNFSKQGDHPTRESPPSPRLAALSKLNEVIY